MRLWRATTREGYTGQWSCWAESKQDALEYARNPGFGGQYLYCVDVEPSEVLDLTGARNEFARLAEVLYPELSPAERADLASNWRGAFGYIYEVWENNSDAAARLSHRFRWVRYEDDYPYRCLTWVYLGTEPLPATCRGVVAFRDADGAVYCAACTQDGDEPVVLPPDTDTRCAECGESVAAE